MLFRSALGLVSVKENRVTWLEALDVALKGRFSRSDLPTLFIAVLDRMIQMSKVRNASLEDKSLYHDALQWAKRQLSEIAEVPETLSSSFSRGQEHELGERKLSLHTIISNRALLDPGEAGNKEISLLRYPVPGFLVIIGLMRDHGTKQEQLRTHLFQRLMYHITEVYMGARKNEKIQNDIEKLLHRSAPRSTHLPPGLPSHDVLTTISIKQLLNCNLLDAGTLESFRTIYDLKDVEKQTGPAMAAYLHHLSAFAATYPSPVDYFNSLKINPLMKKVILTPAAIGEGLSADLISQMLK